MPHRFLRIFCWSLLLAAAAAAQGPLFMGMGDSIGEGVQSADASYFTQPYSYLHLMAWRMSAPFPLPLIFTTPLSVVGDTGSRFRIDTSLHGMNLAVSGADVNSLLNDRADGIINSETDLVLLPRTGSQMEIAEAARPTYVACWIGNNDALGTVLAYDRLDASQLTPLAAFTSDFTAIATRLKAAGSKVVFGTVPDVSQIAVLLSRDEVVFLLGSDFGMAAGDRTSVITFFLIALGLLPPDTLRDPNFVLTASEAALISARIGEFNTVIKSVAAANGFGVADIHQKFNDFIATPPSFYGIPLYRRFMGGLFSLDGVHPSNIAHGLLANEFLQVFNSTYGTSFPPVDATWLNALFLTDPHVDKDMDGRVTGRPGAGLLETLLAFLGISGDSNDFDPGVSSAPAVTTSLPTVAVSGLANLRNNSQASNRFVAEHARLTGRDLRRMSHPERIAEFKRIFGIDRLTRRAGR